MNRRDSPQLFYCGKGTSFFQFVNFFWKDPHSKAPFHRICAIMRLMGAQSVVAERINPNAREYGRFEREIAAIRARLESDQVTIRFQKITFIRKRVSHLSDITDVRDDDIFGFVVIAKIDSAKRPIHTYIFESVIRTIGINPSATSEGQSPLWMSYVRVQRKFKCKVHDKIYVLNGSFFCQQNTITSLCAHACTSMMLNNCGVCNEFVSCEDVNAILGIDHKIRMQEIPEKFGSNMRATHDGLFLKEILQVVRHYGFRPYHMDFEPEKRLYREFLYGFIESGYPAILTFSAHGAHDDDLGHTIVVVGHSLNRHSWFPTAYAYYAGSTGNKPLLSSLNWVDDFIVHDDNFGMQLCLPAHSFRPEDYPDPGSAFMPKTAVGIFPEKWDTKLLGHIAEDLASAGVVALFQGRQSKDSGIYSNFYVEHLRPSVLRQSRNVRPAVIRTLQVTPHQYIQTLKKPDNFGVAYSLQTIGFIESVIGKRKTIWVSEISEPDLYTTNESKVLDAILDPHLALDHDSTHPMILMRLPHCLVTVASRGDSYKFKIRRIAGIEGHIPLIDQASTTLGTRDHIITL